MDVCLCVLKESNKRSFDSYSVWNSVLIISHIAFRDRRVHIFADNLSRNSCILYKLYQFYDIKVSQIYDYKLITKKLADSFQVMSRLHPYTLELLLHI